MQDISLYLTMAVAGLMALGILVHAALRGWNGWLDLKRAELEGSSPNHPPPVASRIDVADIRERLRKLEALAAGVDY